MCGIVGMVGVTTAVTDVVTGLKKLEYRGYDSAGVATLDTAGDVLTRKAAGKILNLSNLLTEQPLRGHAPLAIGHTRWATHGAATTHNAHPHQSGKVAVVHNGIIENFQHLRDNLSQQGVAFASDTDTETIPALLNAELQHGKTLAQAAQAVVPQLRGAFAVAAIAAGEAQVLVGFRRGAPLVVGVGNGQNYLGSDPLALAGFTNQFIYLEDDDIAVLTPTNVTILRPDGTTALRQIHTLDVNSVAVGKAGHAHFMLKEILEQPAIVGTILSTYLAGDQLNLPAFAFDFARVPQVNIVACGTAYLAGTVGKYLFEQYARVPVNVDVASEFRYRQPPYQPGGVFIAVSQSGETADTLAALEDAKANGQHIITLTNTPTSSMARASDVVIELLAGPEIAVASTKAFTAMVLGLTLVALKAAQATNPTLNSTALIQDLRQLPSKIEHTLGLSQPLRVLSGQLAQASSMLYLGRGMLQPIAYEGALKMKEITYIHAEGYGSGEMKHGPIALVDHTLPVINLATSTDGLFEKTISNMKEVEARHGQVILLTDAAGKQQLDQSIAAKATILMVPDHTPLTAPFIFTIPLQLLAYYTALAKGTDVDQPRNLAKSVTVE